MFSRGELYYAKLDPTIGSEQGGTRPVLIIQNNKGNKYSPTIIICPLTTRKKNILPTHIKIDNINGIKEDSIVLIEQLRVIDKKRIRNRIGKINKKKMQEVNEALDIALGKY